MNNFPCDSTVIFPSRNYDTASFCVMILTINGQQAALKKGSSIEYVSENRIFTDADDYSMEIELPLADCP